MNFSLYHVMTGDLTVPGKLQVELGEDYTGKTKIQKSVQFGVNVEGQESSSLELGEGLAKVQLFSKDEKRMVGVGPAVLSVHTFRPYQASDDPNASGWREFKKRISKVLDAYWEVMKPKGVSRVGIRYINYITIPSKRVRIEDYLACALPVVHDLPNEINRFTSRVEYVYSDEERLILSHATMEQHSKTLDFLLDLDVIWQNDSSIKREEALEVAERLRTREREAFEIAITDRARELFDAD